MWPKNSKPQVIRMRELVAIDRPTQPIYSRMQALDVPEDVLDALEWYYERQDALTQRYPNQWLVMVGRRFVAITTQPAISVARAEEFEPKGSLLAMQLNPASSLGRGTGRIRTRLGVICPGECTPKLEREVSITIPFPGEDPFLGIANSCGPLTDDEERLIPPGATLESEMRRMQKHLANRPR